MTLHLARVGVDLHALARFTAARRLSDDDGGYALHAALAARFGDGVLRPFRFLPDHAAGAHLLGYVTDPATLADAAALPVVDDLLDRLFTTPQVRAMPDTWRVGARYGFEVRVRPVVRFGKTVRAARADRPGAWQRRAGEIDAFVAACERAVAEHGDTATVDRETVYLDWLGTRLARAATLDAASVRLFRRSRTRRSTHRSDGARTRAVEGPDVVIGGTLTVTDADAFADLLARGVGRHAGFGYGMLLLSAPGRGG